MSIEAITTILDVEERKKQILADGGLDRRFALGLSRFHCRCSGRLRVGKAQRELQTLRAKSDEKAKADAEKLAAETKNKEAAMRIKAKTNLDRAASLIVERIVNG